MSYKRKYINQINTHIPMYSNNNNVYLQNNYFGNQQIYYQKTENFSRNSSINNDRHVTNSSSEMFDYSNYSLSNQVDNNNFSASRNEIIDDFLKTLRQSQVITNKIMNQYKLINDNQNQQKYNFISSNDNNYKIKKDNYFNNNIIDTYAGDLEKKLNLNYNNKYDGRNLFIHEKIEDYNFRQFNNNNNSNLPINETEKYKKINEELINSNLNLDGLNKRLQTEVNQYKLKTENKSINLNKSSPNFSFNDYGNILKKFIDGVKKSLQKSINENLQLNTKIIITTNQMSTISNNINTLNNKYQKFFQKLSIYNNKINYMNLYNVGNSNRYENLKEQQNELNKKLEKLKIENLVLKSKENVLGMQNKPNLKCRYNNEDLVLKLYSTMNQLNEEQIKTNQNIVDKTKKLENDKKTLNFYNNQILTLKKVLENLENEKKMLNNSQNSTKTTDNFEKDENLEMELNILKNENQKIQKDVNGQKIQINKLNGIINNLTAALKNNTLEEELKKYDLNKIINEENGNSNTNKKIEINIKKNEDVDKLDYEIEQALKANASKNNEIQSIKKLYNDLINLKDQRIEKYEKQYIEKENMKISEVNDVITENINFNAINYGDYGKVEDSYNEDVEDKNDIKKNSESIENFNNQQKIIPESGNYDHFGL